MGRQAAIVGVHVSIGEAPVADSTSMLIPPYWVYVAKATPGQKLSLISNDGATPIFNVTQLTK